METLEGDKSRQRKRDFVLLIIFEITTWIVANIMNHEDYRFSFPPKSWIFGIMFFFLIPYYFLLYKVTSNYVTKRIYKIGYGLLILTGFVLTGVASQKGVSIESVKGYAYCGYLLQVAAISLIVIIIVVDMFKHQHDLTYGILAATTVYFLIPVFFAYIFCVMGLGDPSLLRINPNNIGGLIVKSFESSHLFAAGMDLPDPGVSGLIKMVAVLESYIVNLYIVFVVGKLFVSSKL